MKCKKVRYKDHEQATFAIHTIQQRSIKEQVPVRAYECDLCHGWHLTKAQIITNKAASTHLKFYDQWKALIKSTV